MKLILCTKCQDVVRLFDEERQCKCGAISGKYVGDSAVYKGDRAVPLIFDNNTLVRAIADQPENGEGHPFGAKVVAQHDKDFKKCRTNTE